MGNKYIIELNKIEGTDLYQHPKMKTCVFDENGMKYLYPAKKSTVESVKDSIEKLSRKIDRLERGETRKNIEEKEEIPSWNKATNEEVVELVEKHRKGLINLYDHWHIGDEREVYLRELDEVMQLVLMDKQNFEFTDGTKCIFTIGSKNCLSIQKCICEKGIAQKWLDTDLNAYLNNILFDCFPHYLQHIMKPFHCPTPEGIITELLSIPSEIEVFGEVIYGAKDKSKQFEYYKNRRNRIKFKMNDEGANIWYWLRSPYSSYTSGFCFVYANGTADDFSANNAYGLAPFGCI